MSRGVAALYVFYDLFIFTNLKYNQIVYLFERLSMKEKAFFSYENDNVSVSADHFVVNKNIVDINNIEYVNIGCVKSSIGFYVLFLIVGAIFVVASKLISIGFSYFLDYYNVFGWFLIFSTVFFYTKNKISKRYLIVLKIFGKKEEVFLGSTNLNFIQNVFGSLSDSIKNIKP